MEAVLPRSQVRTPLLISFSILLLAVSAMGIFLFVKYDELGTTLSAIQKENKTISYLQREQRGMLRAENSVHAFVVSHDLLALQSYYVYSRIFDQRRDYLFESVDQDSLQDQVRRFIDLTDQRYRNMGDIISIASQGRDMAGFFERISLKIDRDSLAQADTLGGPSTLSSMVDSANRISSRMNFPVKLPEVELDAMTDSITLSREAFFNLRGYQFEQEAKLRRLIREGELLSTDLAQATRNLERSLEKISGREASGMKQKFIRVQQFFIIFSIATVLMGLVFLAYIINTLDRNRRLQEELEEEKARAERLAQAKEEFLANISHEIRTPMNAVIGFSEQLAQTSLQPLQQRLLEPLRNSAQYLLALINDILDISKLDSGNFRLDQQGFRPEALIEDVETIFARQARQKGLTLRCEVDSDLPEVLIGDPLRLKQMLYNLVSNALKFTEQGEVALTVSQERAARDSQLVSLFISVQDTGIGIPPDKRNDIFSKFIQAESHTARRFGGTGLGLAITKRLTELMEGQISLESEVGQGTTVHLHLPLLIGSPAALRAGEKSERLDPTPLQGQRVLLVDDEIYNRELAQYILDKWQMDVVAVEDGQAALNRLEEDPAFALILMDLHMPRISGIEATQQIRQRLGLTLPILAMTATATPARLREAQEAGMNGHLLKPFRETELLSILLRLLDLPEVTGSPEAPPLSHAGSEPPALAISGPEAPSTEYSLEAMYRLAHDNERFVKRMLTLFVERSEEALQTLQAAAAQQDWGQVGMSAHKLVPPCRHLGLHQLVDRLKHIERDVEADQGISSERIEAVVADLTAVREAIQADVAQLDREG